MVQSSLLPTGKKYRWSDVRLKQKHIPPSADLFFYFSFVRILLKYADAGIGRQPKPTPPQHTHDAQDLSSRTLARDYLQIKVFKPSLTTTTTTALSLSLAPTPHTSICTSSRRPRASPCATTARARLSGTRGRRVGSGSSHSFVPSRTTTTRRGRSTSTANATRAYVG